MKITVGNSFVTYCYFFVGQSFKKPPARQVDPNRFKRFHLKTPLLK